MRAAEKAAEPAAEKAAEPTAEKAAEPAAEKAAGAPPGRLPAAAVGTERSLCGWGGIAPSRALVTPVRDVAGVVEALAGAGRARPRVLARGMARSYGDAAQSEGGQVLDMRGLDAIEAIDREQMTVTVQAGVTLACLLERLAGLGLTLPVLPGTCQVSVGGTLAADVHGKSHHHDGSIARHVRELRLCLPGGELVDVSAQADRELFEATLGGMGLTGAIVRATLSVQELASPWVAVDVDRTADLEQTLALLAGPETHRFSVAWLDLLARSPRALGRGIVSRADPWPAGAEGDSRGALDRSERSGWAPASPRARNMGQAPVARRAFLSIPTQVPSGLLRPSFVRALGAARWRRCPRRARGRRVALGSYLFPLDALGHWSRLYGRAGLVQYQFAVPLGQERELVRCIELLRARRLPVYLAVLKRFGGFAAGPLSFPVEGFALALDLPGGADGLWSALDALDEIVARAGGRVYLAKDVRLRGDVLPVMYPQLDRFQAVRARVDPERLIASDLSRRLGL
jgi:decaprenylphospho-beta-D-ribofuranose 2-oxidase